MALKRTAWDHGGRNATKRGYGRQHQKLREQLLRDEPLCRMCGAKGRTTAATIADHIVSLAKGGAANDLSNLQPLCRPCHDRKTLTEQGKRYRCRINPDGWPADD